MIESIDRLKYPIGKFQFNKDYNENDIAHWIKTIEELPEKLNHLSKKLTPELLLKSYRPNGWNAQQIIHHIADSHINAFIRLKLTLTEDTPTICAYNQDKWVTMADMNEPVDTSLQIIENIHKRFVKILKSMKKTDFKKTYFHPEYKKTFTLDEFTSLYAWHGEQHLAHLEIILNSNS